MAPSHPTPPTGPDDAGRPGSPALVDFTVDLTAQEALRQAQVLAAIGPDWDPIAVLRGEEAAYDLLYSGLDADQQRLYDDLVAAGVLPRRGGGRAAA
ncbi:DUF6400 family protein [Streptomyces goshikiensis]|uniref:DUF6400 family protein n=1 Tax=Streptomyces TaxID=1883 RepID=UPI000F3AA7BC|nr:DUF6400 family protein [Streptomyces sp. ADI95-16]AYV26166.1 hypothetical protein EES41_05485 [Streptomyces sp. ADI95-16]